MPNRNETTCKVGMNRPKGKKTTLFGCLKVFGYRLATDIRFLNQVLIFFTCVIALSFAFVSLYLDRSSIIDAGYSPETCMKVFSIFGDSVVPTVITFALGVYGQIVIITQSLNDTEQIAAYFVVPFGCVFLSMWYIIARLIVCWWLVAIATVLLSPLLARISIFSLPALKETKGRHECC